ncbi:deoxyuridine 5'-triphosphate nucleotidohydrolase-like [Anomaloglossus baeobatrachus]|uniref:deoxyuridine 5'-triphosphate nucleotidohydrolase-like n=1 Tax=Anomaloglossus baeobatrachus TaxID=238106 RepID=UPI003F5089ED
MYLLTHSNLCLIPKQIKHLQYSKHPLKEKKTVVPEKSTPLSAGLDLHSTKVVLITPGKVGIIPTGLGYQIPKAYYGQIATRSSFALKGAVVVGGVIDVDYQGEIKVIMINMGEEPLIIEKDQRMAQMLLIPISLATAEEGSAPTELIPRGDKGFGSSNITNVGAKIWIQKLSRTAF